jgi:hypothetical protein
LCNAANSLYCTTGERWDRVVLQLFDDSLIASAEVVMVPLECEDIRGGGKRLGMQERIAKLVGNIKRLQAHADRSSRYVGLCGVRRVVGVGIVFYGGAV